MRELSDIKKIIIHCSDSDYGDVKIIDKWHKGRGWDSCGYHYIITNGKIEHGDTYDSKQDGIVQIGRRLTKIGAHCKGHNRDSIGICLIGRHHFTGKQLLNALPSLLIMLGELGLGSESIYGHCEFSPHKTCPNIDPRFLRAMI